MSEPDNPLNPVWDTNSNLDFTKDTQVGTLPTRGEKTLVPVQIDEGANAEYQARQEAINSGIEDATYVANTRTSPWAYEKTTGAATTLTDYVTVRIPLRSANGTAVPYTFRFLINPKTVQVTRQTVDSHAMARGGWQFGIWGEDTIDIHMSGTSAGRFFENGLTDKMSEYTISQRNLMELVNLFENNGYFFEGERANNNWNAPGYMRKRIRSHADVELQVGNFIWSGMFLSMTINNSADTPYFCTFELNFLAWKERFASQSPWRSAITNPIPVRGHDQEIATQATPASLSLLSPSDRENIPNILLNPLSGGAGFAANLVPNSILNSLPLGAEALSNYPASASLFSDFGLT